MKEVLDYLHRNELLGVSDSIEIAKGKNEAITSFKDAKYKIKRLWQKRK